MPSTPVTTRGPPDGQARTVVLASIYGQGWVSIAPYTLLAYAEKFEIARDFRIVCREFDSEASVESIVSAIEAEDPDLVGFSMYVFTVKRTLEVLPHLDCSVVLGGPEVVSAEEELLRDHPNVDWVVTGEGERSFVALLEHLRGLRDLHDVPGLTTREARTLPAPGVLDLDEIPSVYERLLEDHDDLHSIAIETQRGCPYRCRYCAWSSSRKVRYRNLQAVLRDLSQLAAHPSIESIYLADSSLFVDKERAKAILRHLIEIGCRQHFLYELNIEHVDDELIDLMARLPHQEFSFGIQAVGEGANLAMGRRFDRDKFRRNYEKIVARMSHPQLAVDLIYPMPGDTLDGFMESLEFALRLDKLKTLKLNPLVLLRGSEFFERQEELGIELREGTRNQVGACAGFSRHDVELAREYAFYVQCIFRKPPLAQRLRGIADDQGRRLVDVIVDFFKSLPFDVVGGMDPPEMLLADAQSEIQAAHQRAMMMSLLDIKHEVVDACVRRLADRGSVCR